MLLHKENETEFEYEVTLPIKVKLKINYDLEDGHPIIQQAEIADPKLKPREVLLALHESSDLQLFDTRAWHALTANARNTYIERSKTKQMTRTLPMTIDSFAQTISDGDIQFPVKSETLRKFFRDRDVLLEPAIEANISFYVWPDMYESSLLKIKEEDIASNLNGAKLQQTSTGELRVYWQIKP